MSSHLLVIIACHRNPFDIAGLLRPASEARWSLRDAHAAAYGLIRHKRSPSR